MAHVYKDESGKVIEVQMDERITDPNDELAVQVPPEADGSQDNALAPLLEPSPNDFAAKEAEEDDKGE